MTENNGWMDLDHVPIFTKDGRQFAMILSSENYKHVNVINRDTNQRVPITTGDMVVTNIYFWDEEENKIYFRATRVGGPGERHVCITFSRRYLCILGVLYNTKMSRI